jgi:hypothetical protein
MVTSIESPMMIRSPTLRRNALEKSCVPFYLQASRQCINRRFDSASQMDRQIEAWQTERNRKQLGAN